VKIALCHNTFFYLYLHYRQLIAELIRRYDTVYCIAPSDAHARQLEAMGVRCIPVRLSQTGLNPLREFRAVRQYARIFREIRPDVVFGFSVKPIIYSGIAARITKVPKRFAMVTGLGYVFTGNKPRQRMLRPLIKGLYRMVLAGCDTVFFQNDDDRKLFLRLGLVTGARAVVLAGTGIDTEEFKPGPARPFAGRYLYIGRMLRDKGVVELVEAARVVKRKHPDARFVLVGSTDSNPAAIPPEQMKSWEKEGVISCAGAVDDVRPFIEDSDVFVLPSYREGLPRATLEAMAMGRAIVTTDAPGCRRTVLDGENGVLVPVADATALAKAMLRFYAEPGLAESQGRRSREIAVKTFDVNNVVRSVMDRLNKTDVPGGGTLEKGPAVRLS